MNPDNNLFYAFASESSSFQGKYSGIVNSSANCGIKIIYFY